jgi:hypothetical protein
MGLTPALVRFALCAAVAACRTKDEPPPAPVQEDVATLAFVAGHVIVKMRPGAPASGGALERNGLVKVKRISGNAALYRIEGLDPNAPNARALTIAIVDDLKKDPSVAAAELDYVIGIDLDAPRDGGVAGQPQR